VGSRKNEAKNNMPNVKGKKFGYGKKGMAAAKKHAAKTGSKMTMTKKRK